MVKIPSRFILAVFGLVLAGCSASFVNQLPESIGGLPAEAPPAPQTPYQYPAVHDLPPPRSARPMSDEEVLNAENALKAARDRQEKLQRTMEGADKGN